jgi:hypothetical protein
MSSLISLIVRLNPYGILQKRKELYSRKIALYTRVARWLEGTYYDTSNYKKGLNYTLLHPTADYSAIVYNNSGGYDDRSLSHLLRRKGGGTQWDIVHNTLMDDLGRDAPQCLEKLIELFRRQSFSRKDLRRCFRGTFDFLVKDI